MNNLTKVKQFLMDLVSTTFLINSIYFDLKLGKTTVFKYFFYELVKITESSF